MNFSYRLDQWHAQARQNKWMGYFAVCLRLGLALGFLPSGMVKIFGERFTALSSLHPMGAYLEALHHTGGYYTFVGIMQVTAALLLLIPATATLGALIYLPIILNICILSIAVRFEGSLFSSPLMVLACLYLICWDYHKIRLLFPFNRKEAARNIPPADPSSRFPFRFFFVVATVMISVVLFAHYGFDIYPRNTSRDCRTQCPDSSNPAACETFCDCIHRKGVPLDSCLRDFHKSAR